MLPHKVNVAQNFLDIINDISPSVMPERYGGKGYRIFDAVETVLTK